MDGPPPHMLPPNVALPAQSRKRPRELESPEQRAKREKATERQRRKRARDREALLHNSELTPMAHGDGNNPPPTFETSPLTNNHNQLPPPPGEFNMQAEAGPSQQQQEQREPTAEELDAMRSVEQVHEAITGQVHRVFGNNQLTPAEINAEEMAKRERVRIAARERQRKHRALVKQRKMRELGIDMGNEVIPPHMPYDITPGSAAYQHHGHPEEGGIPGEMVQPQGGAMFAQTLLLAFACAPLLKGPVLRSLGMTQEDLNQFEGIIASAWDQWDYGRRQYHAHQAAQAAQHAAQAISNGAAAAAVAAVVGAGGGPNDDDEDSRGESPAPNDFRARFRQSIAPPLTGIPPPPPPAAVIDPELGQGRIEAEAVADHLERFERGLQG